jgi:hypothetical protein
MRIAKEAELAIEKVAANHKESAKFPLASDPKSVEQILAARFKTLPEVTRTAAATRALTRINAPKALRVARFGDLSAIDQTKPVAVDSQANAIPLPPQFKFQQAEVGALANLHGSVLSNSAGLIPMQTTNRLELRIHKVKCLDETDGFLGSEAGDDEIDLGGTTVDESGDTKKVNPFRVGSSFDDGEQVVFSPPRRFAMFNLSEGTAFPKSYFATLVLAEVDMGGLPDFIDKLLNWVKAKVVSVLTTAIGTAIGASGGPIGALIGAAVGAVVGLVFDLFKSIWEDDVFKPATVSVSIPSLTARWAGKTDSPEGVLTFSGHGGKYQLTYDWQLLASAAAES